MADKIAQGHRLRPLFAICISWVIIVYYAEWLSPKWALKSCHWPSFETESVDTAHTALIADPQLVDDNTYPGRSSSLEYITETVVDRYLARNWRLVNRVLDPDSFFFLGDLFDGGREWDDEKWFAELQRWNRIFPRPVNKLTSMNLPGNHDIGFGNTINKDAVKRFSNWFGSPNQAFPVGGHQFVTLDTISLSNNNDTDVPLSAQEFLNEWKSNDPVVLLTHVPLNRPPGTKCGRYREGGDELKWTKGYQYVTQTTPELSQEILKTFQPAAIFSGDDHDACHVKHYYTPDGRTTKDADEYTVKSFSMAMGISKPGLQLITVDPKQGYKTNICLLSSPFYPFICYGVCLSLTILAMLIRHWPIGQYSSLPRFEDDKNFKVRGRSLIGRFSLRPFFKELGIVLAFVILAELIVTHQMYSDI